MLDSIFFNRIGDYNMKLRLKIEEAVRRYVGSQQSHAINNEQENRKIKRRHRDLTWFGNVPTSSTREQPFFSILKDE